VAFFWMLLHFRFFKACFVFAVVPAIFLRRVSRPIILMVGVLVVVLLLVVLFIHS